MNCLNNDRINFIRGDFNNSAYIKGEGYEHLLLKGLLDTYNLAETKDNGVTVKGKIDGWETILLICVLIGY